MVPIARGEEYLLSLKGALCLADEEQLYMLFISWLVPVRI